MENKLPKGWASITLKELCNMVYGKGLLTKHLTADGYPVFGANGIIGKNSSFTYKEPQVIISCRGAASGAIHKTVPYSFVTSNSIVLGLKSKEIDLDYFQKSLLSVDRSKIVTGSAQPQITIENLNDLEIPIAPLPEQHRIVAKLEAIFEKIESNKQRLEKIPKILKRFRQSVLAAAVSGKLTEDWRIKQGIVDEWAEVELNSIIPKGGIFDGPFGSNLKTADYTEKGVRVIRLENIEHLFFVKEKETYITEEKYQTLIRHTVGEGDIIFSSFIAEEIRACILPKLETKAIAKADCFCIRPDKNKVDKWFLLYSLVSMASYQQLVVNIHGATRPRINTTQLKTLQILLPKLEEQQEIVRRVEQLFALADKLEARYTKAKAMLDKLPQSILAKAFWGELVPQDPKDEPASILLERIASAKLPKSKINGRAVNRDYKMELL